ncbi:MAG: hypothetical protein RLY80_51, partial [Actinomycetota bacterium]
MRGLLPLSNQEIDDALNSHHDLIAPPSSYAYLISLRALRKPLLVITASSKAAEDLAKEIRECHPDTLEFPAWETLPHERLSPSSDTVAKRISTLQALQDRNRNWVVVAPIRAVIHRFNSQIIETKPITIDRGVEFDLTELQRELVSFSYSRTDLVERRGEFAVRGGILDIFPPDQNHPIRIDFFGDEIEELSYFAVADQRTFESISTAVKVLPCRELLITDEVREKAKNLTGKYENDLLSKISNGLLPEGMESLIPILVEKMELISTSMPNQFETISMPNQFETIFIERERVVSRLSDLLATNQEFKEAAWSNAAIGGNAPVPIEVENTYIEWDELIAQLPNHKDFRQFGADDDLFLDLNSIEPLRGSSERLISLFESALNENK